MLNTMNYEVNIYLNLNSKIQKNAFLIKLLFNQLKKDNIKCTKEIIQ